MKGISSMSNNPKVTIVIPMYKTPFMLLRRCLNSVLHQTFQDYELLVVDDGSGSGYDELKAEYESLDPRVHFLVKENGGVASARNYGIDHSRGEFINFIDSDDYVEEYFIEGLYNGIKDCDLAICGVTEMYFSVEDSMYNEKMFFSLPSHFDGLQYINFSVNKLYKTQILKEHNIRFPLDVKLGEDALFLAEYFRHVKYIRCLPACPYHYVLNTESAMRSYKPEYWSWETQVIKKDWDLFHQYPLSGREEIAIAHWLYKKMMGAANYYFDYETDPKELMRHFQEILDNEHIKILLRTDISEDRVHFKPEERVILKAVKRRGIHGLRKYVHKRIGP